MGKYSLDAFERYPLVKLRPAIAKPQQTCYRLTPEENGCLRVNGLENCVVLNPGSLSADALAAWLQDCRERFGQMQLLAEPGTELSRLCQKEGIPTGLWLPLERGILALRRAIGEEGLSRRWERCPVYVCAGRELTREELDAACRWHASGADTPAPLGARLTLRRMMFPQGLTAGGVMPLRMWWQNLGTAPVYRETRVHLELRKGAEHFPILIPESMAHLGLGDSTLNVTAQLPALPCGTYDLWCGLESGGSMLPLAMEAEEHGRMYRIGQLTLDDLPRHYLATMWQEQYADGYYPLEDPAQPE